MNERPLRTTVIGSYPFPSWLEYASGNLDQFGSEDVKEMQDDAVAVAICWAGGASGDSCLTSLRSVGEGRCRNWSGPLS